VGIKEIKRNLSALILGVAEEESVEVTVPLGLRVMDPNLLSDSGRLYYPTVVNKGIILGWVPDG